MFQCAAYNPCEAYLGMNFVEKQVVDFIKHCEQEKRLREWSTKAKASIDITETLRMERDFGETGHNKSPASEWISKVRLLEVAKLHVEV
jgi:hypothetical protein